MRDPQTKQLKTDFLIIGSGAAGLLAASRLAPHGQVTLVNKGTFQDSSTWYAQGGIAGVLSNSDSIASHVQDTLLAGAGLCHEDVAHDIIKHGRKIIEELIEMGARFDRKDGSLHL
ncbi:MAG: FAD-dependent oxidoreductase, partial [Mariprofundus sp.]